MTSAPALRSVLHARNHGLAPGRRLLGLALLATVLPAMTGALVLGRGRLGLGSVLLLYLLAVVVLSVVGGIVVGALAAVGSFLLANFFLTPPYHTFDVESRDSVITLVVFLGVAVTVSVLVDVAARREAAAARSQAETAVLQREVAEPLAERSPEHVLAEIAHTFDLRTVALVETAGGVERVLASVGQPARGAAVTVGVDIGRHRQLRGTGGEFFAEDRRLLSSLAHAASRAVDIRALATEAERAAELAVVDRLRSALLAAVGHDLRTPLAGIKAAVTTLRQPAVRLDDGDVAELLATIEESTDRLGDLIANLLDLSRLEAGALSVTASPVALDEIVARVIVERTMHDVENRVPDDLPLVLADAGLLDRIVANLVDNASRYSPAGTPVVVEAEAAETSVVLRVVDRGPGVPQEDWPRLFVPFQRLHDRGADAGVGLGLAIARGFAEAMGGQLDPSSTPGGGLTMSLTLPRADPVPGRSGPA